jgi:hypothetical protein
MFQDLYEQGGCQDYCERIDEREAKTEAEDERKARQEAGHWGEQQQPRRTTAVPPSTESGSRPTIWC